MNKQSESGELGWTFDTARNDTSGTAEPGKEMQVSSGQFGVDPSLMKASFIVDVRQSEGPRMGGPDDVYPELEDL